MTIIKTPFGEYEVDEDGKIISVSKVVDTPAETPVPPPQDPLSLKYTDPSIASREEATTDLEALRFTQLHRLYVLVNGVCLAHKFWQNRTRLETWEQSSMSNDHGKLMYFILPSSGDNKVELIESGPNVTLEDVEAIATAFPHRRVYWKGAEVKA